MATQTKSKFRRRKRVMVHGGKLPLDSSRRLTTRDSACSRDTIYEDATEDATIEDRVEDAMDEIDEDAAEPEAELVATLDGDEYHVEQDEDGDWLVYRIGGRSEDDGDSYTTDSRRHASSLRKLNEQNAALWARKS